MGIKSKVVITLIDPNVHWGIISERFHLSRAQSYRVRNKGFYIEDSEVNKHESSGIIFVNKLYANGAVTGGEPLDISSLRL